ncbi:MAG TPA: nitroreductase family deazaflavin-dependent oxidoreductase [Baekduia sp.]|nr:nitroreductase family deazaflavin-dependent oxidoreductase [Baekduia sp.]
MLYGQEHVERYEATGGQEGHDWQGTQTLVLTTKGRRSGEPRKSPLIYGEHEGDVLVVASKGGDPEPPAWYLNLEADPEVEVQVWGERFAAHARTATPEEKPELWRIMVGHWPAYEEYQEKTDRDIPVVVLERRG